MAEVLAAAADLGTLVACIAGVTIAAVLPCVPRLVQAGQLSSAHRMFNDDCSRCHQENFQTTKKLLDWSGDQHVVSDKACTAATMAPRITALHSVPLRAPSVTVSIAVAPLWHALPTATASPVTAT